MPFAIVMFILMPFGLEWIALYIVAFGVSVILDIAYFVASLDYAVYRTSQFRPEALYLFTAGFVMALLVQGRARFLCLVPLTLCVFYALQSSRPAVLISEEGKLMAVQLQSGSYAVNTLRTERFVRENWARTLGLGADDFQRWPGEGRLENLSCDEAACRLESGAYQISFVKKESALPEECSWADLVIALNAQDYPCGPAQLIARENLYAGGAHAVAIKPSGLEIKNVQDLRGDRPWNSKSQKNMNERAE
jgi:competence protein ComEC